MSAILTILGRATRDPEMQQGKNSGTEYVSLDIAVSQRGQDGKEETIYYQCYFNKFLAERLAKAVALLTLKEPYVEELHLSSL